MIVAGCDVSCTTGKVVIMDDGKILSHSIVPSRVICEDTAVEAMKSALEGTDLKLENIEYIVGTGYGRINIPFAKKNITEISCHGMGAFWTNPEIRTVIDIGGQDCKVIKLEPDGKVREFVMNEKCAAGTGRFLEDTALALGIAVEDLGPLSLNATSRASVSAQCSVFAETEVVSLMAEQRPLEEIVAGINDAVASRLAGMVLRVGMEEQVVLSGGVSKNVGVMRFLQERMKVDFIDVSEKVDPQLMGALGAAILASQRADKGERRTRRRRSRAETA
jgi:predicted CoA-substrate-specific enzyme activase